LCLTFLAQTVKHSLACKRFLMQKKVFKYQIDTQHFGKITVLDPGNRANWRSGLENKENPRIIRPQLKKDD
jgi:hypothetical protein